MFGKVAHPKAPGELKDAREGWLKAVTDELSGSKAAIIVKNLDPLKELAGLYIDLRNLLYAQAQDGALLKAWWS